MSNLINGMYPNTMGVYQNRTHIGTATPWQTPRRRRLFTNVYKRKSNKISRNFRFAGAGLVNSTEYKFVDTLGVTYSLDTSGTTISCINLVAQGLDVNNRIGRKVLMTSCQIRGIIQPAAAAVVVPQIVALSLVYDMQADGALATVSGAAGMYVGNNAIDLLNGLNGQNRFRVLWSRVWVIAPRTNTAGQGDCFAVDEYIKMKLPVGFDGTAATIASLETGGLYMVCRGSLAAGANPAIFFANTRVRFTNHE